MSLISCNPCIGTGPPRVGTQVIYVGLEYLAISGSIPPKRDPASWGPKSELHLDKGVGFGYENSSPPTGATCS